MLEELGKILVEMDKDTDKVLKWYEKYRDNPIFTTDDGKELRTHLAELCKQHAYSLFKLSVMELQDALISLKLSQSEQRSE